MPGIAGITGPKATQQQINTMLSKLRHRGPDDQWSVANGDLAFGTCMSNLGKEKGLAYAECDGITVLFDGEIYNERPEGAADVEVALDMYRKHGRTFASQLQGVFACAITDGNDVVLARDAVGVRPLYWGRDETGSICFASELKALTGIVSEVHDLPPASVYSSKTGLQPYLPSYPEVEVPDSVDEARDMLRELLVRATDRRLADGRVGGVLLSGGLDSSIIAAIAHEINPRLPAFTVAMTVSYTHLTLPTILLV